MPKAKAPDKERITLYIDKRIHDDAKALAKELGMSLSALTRLLYVFGLSFRHFQQGMSYLHTRLEARYPEGIPDEELVSAQKEFFEKLARDMEKWGTYTRGLLDAAGIPGVKVGSGETISMQEAFQQAISDLESMKHLADALNDDDQADR
jgi:AraC-like DNA-binding protein